MAGQGFLTLLANGAMKVVNALQNGGGNSANAGAVPALDANGRLDPSFMPSGVGADTITATTTEALAAGAWVNLYSGGVRNADCSAANGGKTADGFVLAAYASGVPATVQQSGQNTAVTGQTAGADVFLGTAGAGTSAPPTTSGYTVQRLGKAATATDVEFKPYQPVILA